MHASQKPLGSVFSLDLFAKRVPHFSIFVFSTHLKNFNNKGLKFLKSLQFNSFQPSERIPGRLYDA